MDEIGSLLKSTREESGISLMEASKDLDIKDIMLENIESGKIGAFKDIFELKEDLKNYSKYLGLDDNKILNEFNEYLFEYTSKIPVKEIEKAVKEQVKEEKEVTKVISPYTKEDNRNQKYFILVYLVILLLVILTIIWSVKQITVDKHVATAISYVD